jgi:hypothetical protein
VTPFLREKAQLPDDIAMMDERINHLESQVSLAKANLERDIAKFDSSRTEASRRRRTVDKHIQIILEIRALKNNLKKLESESSESSDPVERALQKNAFRLRGRLRDADDRWRAAREIIAMPIDDLQTEELLAEEAEGGLREAEAATLMGTPKSGELTLERMMMKVAQIEEENELRSEKLAALREDVYRLGQKKRSLLARVSPSVSRICEVQLDDEFQIGEYLDSVYEKLQQRNTALQDLSSQVARIEEEWQSGQSQWEWSYTQKMERIELLNQELSYQDHINVELHAVESESADLRRTSVALQADRLTIDRQAARIREDRRTLESANLSLDAARRKLERRRMELGFRANASALRRASIADAVASLARLRLQRRARKQKIEAIEARTRDTELTTTILLEQIESESADLSVLTLELRHAQRRVRRSLQDELTSSIIESFADSDL